MSSFSSFPHKCANLILSSPAGDSCHHHFLVQAIPDSAPRRQRDEHHGETTQISVFCHPRHVQSFKTPDPWLATGREDRWSQLAVACGDWGGAGSTSRGTWGAAGRPSAAGPFRRERYAVTITQTDRRRAEEMSLVFVWPGIWWGVSN